MRKLVLALAALVASAAPAYAGIVLNDTFNLENGGGSSVPYANFANFTVTNGNVDLVATPDYGIVCAGGSGSCVDLAGSTAGTITSKAAYNYAAGARVSFSFDISGSQRGGSNTYFTDIFYSPNSVNPHTRTSSATYGPGQFSNSSPLANGFHFDGANSGGDPFVTDNISFVATAPGTFSFDIGTADQTNAGPVLDNVVLSISAVPEPASWAMMIVGLGLAGAALRRRSQTVARFAA
jgi:hypothetical protein